MISILYIYTMGISENQYKHHIFISYRQKDNQGGHWVTHFIQALKEEIGATFKEDISVYFDQNPVEGLLETHDVDDSLKEKIKCIIFIPILSQTYCDTNSFAWQKELLPFVEFAKSDSPGLKVSLANGNVASRVLPVRIHNLDPADQTLFEEKTEGVLRAIDFVYQEAGVNRPLLPADSRELNLNKTAYANQINKVAQAIKEILNSINGSKEDTGKTVRHPLRTETVPATGKKRLLSRMLPILIIVLLLVFGFLQADKLTKFFSGEDEQKGHPSRENVIAVFPFTHLSADSTDEFFTSGMHLDVMSRLAGVREFRIIAKSAVMQYKGYEGDMKAIGEKLNANYILVGEVRRLQKQVRISTQLIETSSNQVIWSDEFNAELENVFELQSGIAMEIAQKLKADLTQREQQDIESIYTTDLQAYDDYLKARFIVSVPRFTYDDLEQAVVYLNNAIKSDPNFFKAWILLGQVHSERYDRLKRGDDKGVERAAAKEQVVLSLKRAKELAPDSWEVYSEEGYYQFFIEEDPIKALGVLEKAVERNPSDFDSFTLLSRVYLSLGDIDKCIESLERGFQLNHESGLINYGLTFAYQLNGEFEKMIPFLEKLYTLYPEEKHYYIESKYYKFLADGKISSFRDFKDAVENTKAENPWDERAIQNKEMVVAMFNGEFDRYHERWIGSNDSHTKSHGDWMCPLVANDNINHARMLLDRGNADAGNEIIAKVNDIVLRPINRNSVCVFNPDVYLPKIDFLEGNRQLAQQKLEDIAVEILKNDSYPTGAVERAVLLQAVDLIIPERVYFYYEQVVENSISLISFESICADPWTYPNLIKDPQFVKAIQKDGRFVEFLKQFGFLNS